MFGLCGEKIDLPLVLQTAESVCSALGIKVGKSCVRFRIAQVSVDKPVYNFPGLRRIGSNTRAVPFTTEPMD